MAGEFVVSGTLATNQKFRDLSKRLASPANAMWALHRLWAFTALHRPNGDLTGIDPAEARLTITEWAALSDARGPNSSKGFIEVQGEVVVVHDWHVSQGYVQGAEKRRQAARLAGTISQENRREAQQQAWVEAWNGRTPKRPVDANTHTGLSTVVGTVVDEGRSARADVLDPSGISLIQSSEVVSESGDRIPTQVVNADLADSGEKLVLHKSPSAPKRSIGPSPLTEMSKALTEMLDRSHDWFYGLYPKHEKRVKSREAWGKLHRDLLVTGERRGITKAVKQRIADDITRRLKTGEWDPSPERRKYIPDPPVYLNGRRWDD